MQNIFLTDIWKNINYAQLTATNENCLCNEWKFHWTK